MGPISMANYQQLGGKVPQTMLESNRQSKSCSSHDNVPSRGPSVMSCITPSSATKDEK